MKKGFSTSIFALIFTLVLVLCASLPAFAAENEVTVTISDKGSIVLSCAKVPLTDLDSDGALTVNDALLAAHASVSREGDYASAFGEYGLSLTRLWGDTSGAFGYLVNNVPSMSLLDPVKAGDYVCAYIYTDQAEYSDAYTFFDGTAFSSKTGDSVRIRLTSVGFDENWAPVNSPVSDAEILLDGVGTGVFTDKNGVAELRTVKAGTFTVSAKSDRTIVPPCASLTVETAPKTGDLPAAALLLPMLLLPAAFAVRKKK